MACGLNSGPVCIQSADDGGHHERDQQWRKQHQPILRQLQRAVNPAISRITRRVGEYPSHRFSGRATGASAAFSAAAIPLNAIRPAPAIKATEEAKSALWRLAQRLRPLRSLQRTPACSLRSAGLVQPPIWPSHRVIEPWNN